MSKKSGKHAVKKGKAPKRNLFAIVVIIVLAFAMIAVFGLSLLGTKTSSSDNTVSTQQPVTAKETAWEVVDSYPHDPDVFLQGLVWYKNSFYESTGLNGHSTLRHVEFPSGKVLQKIDIPQEFFAEGLALVNDRLIQLTWKSQRGFVYDRETFKMIREFTYPTEGWGLTYDGKNLILSDGSSTLTFLDPDNFQIVRKLNVTMNGSPVRELNELEYINGEIWSNVWHSDKIVRINPSSGQVTSFLDLSGILLKEFRTGREDVLNGIAYDPATKRIFVSGKFWPRLFEIRLKKD